MDKALQREQTRERVKRYREKQSVTKVTHPVLKYLIPGEDRVKMEKIVASLKGHKQLEDVYLGCGRYSIDLEIVSEMLEVT